MTSFHVQFEKVGRELLREAKRREGEWAVLVKAKGDKKKVYFFVLPIPIVLVLHVPLTSLPS